ncbi:MAG: rhodanese-like domain-containing protein [bacterium]|nr:rhodanese-like domain-containing protein [bacterium]
MKKFLLELSVILGLSLVVGLAYNQFSQTPLPLLEKYDPHKVALIVNGHSEKNTESMPILQFEEIDAETLRTLEETQSAIILDARIPADFQTGYIPGALSLPISKFGDVYPSVAKFLEEGKTIICYCEGYHCTDSTMLAMELYKKGHKDIFVYKGGIEEWREMQYPVQTAQEEN